MNHPKLLILFLILLVNSLAAPGQTKDVRVKLIDSITKSIVADSLKERFRRGNSEVFTAYYRGGKVVRVESIDTTCWFKKLYILLLKSTINNGSYYTYSIGT